MMNDNKELNLDELNTVSGGSGLRDHPQYNIIKEFYVQKGINSAIKLGNYYGIKEIYAMVELIREEVG